jgi:hypothetical protein
MGLDMYLSGKRYLSQFDDQDKEIAEKISSLSIKGSGSMRPKEVTFEAMYWRKANAIHNWFVENVQEGEDDCREYYVSIEKLKGLAALCREVVETKNSALLPPTSGFFFGSTDVDEWYFKDLASTADGIDALLANPDADHVDFYYQSSW